MYMRARKNYAFLHFKSAIQISVSAPSGAKISQFSWLVLGILPNRISQTSMTSKKKIASRWLGGGDVPPRAPRSYATDCTPALFPRDYSELFGNYLDSLLSDP